MNLLAPVSAVSVSFSRCCLSGSAREGRSIRPATGVGKYELTPHWMQIKIKISKAVPGGGDSCSRSSRCAIMRRQVQLQHEVRRTDGMVEGHQWARCGEVKDSDWCTGR
jgi:hypothetical protein